MHMVNTNIHTTSSEGKKFGFLTITITRVRGGGLLLLLSSLPTPTQYANTSLFLFRSLNLQRQVMNIHTSPDWTSATYSSLLHTEEGAK